MSTLIENIEKVKNAHSALKIAIANKGVLVPAGTKLSDMPALVDQIQTGGTSGGGTTPVEPPKPTNQRASFAYDNASSIVIPKLMIVDVTTITDLAYCFYNCKNLSSLSLPDGFGQNATTLYQCFANCSSLTSLTLPTGFGQNATNINRCFYYNDKLASLTIHDGFGQNATDFSYCFYMLRALTTLTLPAGCGSNATNLDTCFSYCSGLTTLHLPDGFGQNVTKTTRCFYNCTSLTNITGNPNFKVSFDLSKSTNLTHDSIMVIINGLQTVTTTQTLKLGSTNIAKLTEEEQQVATGKGWTLA